MGFVFGLSMVTYPSTETEKNQESSSANFPGSGDDGS